jgi:integrase
MAGRVYRRCGCRTAETGQQWGALCPLLSRRKDHGRWYFSVQVTGLDGRRNRIRRGGYDTRAIAERELTSVLNLPEPEALRRTWTTRRWLEHWLSIVEDRMRPSPGRAYPSIVHRHLIPHLGTVRLADLDGRTVQRVLDQVCAHRVSRRGRLIKPSTVHRIWSVLRSALNEAHRQGLIAPIRRMRLPDGGHETAVLWTAEREALWRETGLRPPVAVWDVHHVAKFLEGVQDDPLFPMWWLIALRGLRRGEVAALRGADLDATGRYLWVREQILQVDGARHVSPPKSMAGVRLLALDDFTAGLLRRHWQRRQAQSGGWNVDAAGQMFTHPDGRPLRPDWITHRFAELVEQLDLPPVRLHDLRHGAASLAGAANVPLKVIQHDLGHSSAVTTADTYWTVLQELARAGVAATAQLLLSHAKIRMRLEAASQA